MAEEIERASEDLVEKAKADSATVRGPFGKAKLFFRQVLQELSKVTRPTRKELLNYTGVVLAFVVVMMAIISGLDWVFFNVVSFVFGG
jgi:preprotein translocase subunit SecE